MNSNAVCNFLLRPASPSKAEDVLDLLHAEARRREFTVTQILFSARPLPKFGKQMWKREKGDAGGREARWTVCLAALKAIVQHAPFSHYTVLKCLSAWILHRGARCRHSSAWNVPLHVWRNDRMIQKSNLCCSMKVRGKRICQIHTLSHTNRRGERAGPWSSRASQSRWRFAKLWVPINTFRVRSS